MRADLAAWRGQRRKGERIPKEFWRRAARAVRQYGLNPVSHALRLDYYQLKRLAGRCEAQRHREASTGPVFVEVSAKKKQNLDALLEIDGAQNTVEAMDLRAERERRESERRMSEAQRTR